MNILVLINSIIDEKNLYKKFEEKFNDGNKYFVISFEESIEAFQNNNFKKYYYTDFTSINDIIIYSDSKYLKIDSDIFNLYKNLFQKFYNKIKEYFFGFIIIGISEINKFDDSNCIENKLKVIEATQKENYDILPFDLIKYVDFEKRNLKIKISEEIKNHFEILEKYRYFIFTSNKDLKLEIFIKNDEKIPNFAFYIEDINELFLYQAIFKNKIILYLNNDDEIVLHNNIPMDSNTLYQIESIHNILKPDGISANNMFNHKINNFVFDFNSIDFSKIHTNSLYTDIRNNMINCKTQTFIFSLNEEQEENGKI